MLGYPSSYASYAVDLFFDGTKKMSCKNTMTSFFPFISLLAFPAGI